MAGVAACGFECADRIVLSFCVDGVDCSYVLHFDAPEYVLLVRSCSLCIKVIGIFRRINLLSFEDAAFWLIHSYLHILCLMSSDTHSAFSDGP